MEYPRCHETTIPEFITFSGGSSQYCTAGEAARQNLIDTHNWTITDGGLAIDCNTAPSITSPSVHDVTEFQTIVIDVNATDPIDSEGNGLVYSLVPDATPDQSDFSIDPIHR